MHLHKIFYALDLTLCDAAGHELEMQSAFDDFSERAHREFPRTAVQEHNYQLLNQAMLAAGFVGYVNEWWDYRDADQAAYAPLAANPNDF